MVSLCSARCSGRFLCSAAAERGCTTHTAVVWFSPSSSCRLESAFARAMGEAIVAADEVQGQGSHLEGQCGARPRRRLTVVLEPLISAGGGFDDDGGAPACDTRRPSCHPGSNRRHPQPGHRPPLAVANAAALACGEERGRPPSNGVWPWAQRPPPCAPPVTVGAARGGGIPRTAGRPRARTGQPPSSVLDGVAAQIPPSTQHADDEPGACSMKPC